jgi:transcriptional regulator with XRE-family HTH domain
MKENRRKLGLSQAKLAEKADLSTQYIAMIELKRKFPSPETLEQIAKALEIDTPELFSMPPSLARTLKKLHKEILIDLEHKLGEAVNSAVNSTITDIITAYIEELSDAN